MGLDRGLAIGWVVAWSCAGSKFVDLAGSTSGNGAAAPKAWCLGGDLEIYVDSEDVDPAGSSLGNAEVVVACKSGRRLGS
jgi:hypothetical protein